MDVTNHDSNCAPRTSNRIKFLKQPHTVTASVGGDEPELFNGDERMVIQIPDYRPPDCSLQDLALHQSDYQRGALPE